jgi:hypothetical protein
MQIERSLEIAYEDLPLWMRRARQRVDWGLVFIALLSLGVGWSFFVQPGIPTFNSSLNYAFSAADTATALREGRLYPRWSPHVLGGYGAPIPHYYPPGAAYSVALVEVLFTDHTISALRFVHALSLMIAGIAVYALVGRWTNAGGGMVSALLYVFSPYVGLVAPHILGDTGAVITLALMPALLWAINRFLLLHTPFDFAWVSLITAALLWTDPRVWWVGCIMGIVVCITHMMVAPYKARAISVIAAMLLGTILPANYWLPALIEYDLVRWVAPEISPLIYSLDLSDLFTPIQRIDPANLAPSPEFTMGWVIRLFALLSILAVVFERSRRQIYPMVFFGLGMVFILLTDALIPSATWMLGAITLCFAVMGGAIAVIEERLPVSLRRLLLPITLAVILIGSINVWLTPIRTQTVSSVPPIDQIRYEQQGLGAAVLPPGASLPTTAASSLEFNPSLLNSYQFTTSDSNIERCPFCSLEKVAPPQINRNGQINILSQQTHNAEYQINTLQDCPQGQCPVNQPVILNWQTAYFSGWEAWMDDLRLDVRQNPQTGLIDIPIPRTTAAELKINLASTPIRDTSWLLSALAGLLVVVIVRQRLNEAQEPDLDFRLLSPEQNRLVLVLMLSFATIFALSGLPNSPLQLRPQPNSGLTDVISLNVQTEVGLQLFGYRLSQLRYRPGDTIDLALYWRALRTLSENYRVRVYLRDVNRYINRAEQPIRDPGGFPTRRWTTSGYISDKYQIALPEDIYAGNYQIILEAYRCETLEECNLSNRLTFFNPVERESEGMYILPSIITIVGR